MPRRVPDYPDSFAGWNTVSSFGSIVSVVATVLFAYIVYDLFVNGEEVDSNPWQTPAFFVSSQPSVLPLNNTQSLEWLINSPSPFHSYTDLPVQSDE